MPASTRIQAKGSPTVSSSAKPGRRAFYQPKIPHSRLLVLTSDAYHVAVAKADECVTNVLAFIRETKQP